MMKKGPKRQVIIECSNEALGIVLPAALGFGVLQMEKNPKEYKKISNAVKEIGRGARARPMTDKTDEQVVASGIKPCPFCGGSDFDEQRGTPDREEAPHNIICTECGARGPWVYADGKGFTAVEMWNRRADVGEREKAVRLLEAARDVSLYAQEDGHGYHCRTEDIEKLARAVEEWEK